MINADDYYGKEPYVRLHEYLVRETGEREDQIPVCMAGFTLGNTLSDNGGVTRGICQMDGSGRLTGIPRDEKYRKDFGRSSGGGPRRTDAGGCKFQGVHEYVGADAGISAGAGDGICQVFEESDAGRGTKSGVPSPHHHRRADPGGPRRVKVIDTDARWFGVTYQEDKEAVVQAIRKLIQQGVYQEKLFQQ